MSVNANDPTAEKTKRKSKKHKEAKSEDLAAIEPDDDVKDVTGEVVSRAEEPEKKDKKKKRKAGKDEGENKNGAEENAAKGDRERKKKDKERKVVNEVTEEETAVEVISVKGREEKRRKAGSKEKKRGVEGGTQVEDADTEAGGKDKKRKKKEKIAESSVPEPTQGDSSTNGVKSESSKNPKKKRKKGESEGQEESPKEHNENERKKKKRKTSKDGYPDPETDESLTDQGRKALSYAFTHIEDPSKWKFNKAKQNWLIRNLWSEEAIPEVYVTLTIRYLSKVQGGARQGLTKSCQEIISAATTEDPDQKPADGGAAPASPTVPASATIKTQRAKELMTALSGDSE